MPFQNKMSLQQEQFCQLTNRFFQDIKKATSSGNEIKVNIVHKERQENLDGLLPEGKVNNWIFKIVKVDQVEDGSAAVVLSLQCKSFVGSGQIHTRSTWRKKSSKEWRATIPYEDFVTPHPSTQRPSTLHVLATRLLSGMQRHNLAY